MDMLLQKHIEFKKINHELKAIKQTVTKDLENMDFLTGEEKKAIRHSVKKARTNNATSFEITSKIGEKARECYAELSKKRTYLKECNQLNKFIIRRRKEIRKQKEELKNKLKTVAIDESIEKEIRDKLMSLLRESSQLKTDRIKLLEKIKELQSEIKNFKSALDMLEPKLNKQIELENKIKEYLKIRIKFNKLREAHMLFKEENIAKHMLTKDTDIDTDIDTDTDTETDIKSPISDIINNTEILATKETNIEDVEIEEDTMTDTDEDMQLLINNNNLEPEPLDIKEAVSIRNEFVVRYNSALKGFTRVEYAKIFSDIESIAVKLGKEQEKKTKKELNQINEKVFKNIESISENLKVQKELIDYQTEIITQKRKKSIRLFSAQETKKIKKNFTDLNELQSKYFNLIAEKKNQAEYLNTLLHNLEEKLKAQIESQKPEEENNAKFPLKKQFAIANAIAEDNFTPSLMNNDDVNFDKK